MEFRGHDIELLVEFHIMSTELEFGGIRRMSSEFILGLIIIMQGLTNLIGVLAEYKNPSQGL